jgi:hypothetical protein
MFIFDVGQLHYYEVTITQRGFDVKTTHNYRVNEVGEW